MPATSHGVLQAENAVEALVKRWIDTALVKAEQANDIEPRSWIMRPRSWRVDRALEKYDEDQLPLVIVQSRGQTLGAPQDTHGDGTLDVFLEMGVAVFVKDSRRDRSRTISRIYGEAIAQLIDHKQHELPDWLTVSSAPTEGYDEQWRRTTGTEPAQHLGDIAHVVFAAHATGIRARFDAWPDEPFDPAEDPPVQPDDPTVDTADVTVAHL